MPDLNWWVVQDDRDFIIGRVSKFSGMGDGWDRVIALAQDAARSPHLTASSDLLLLECREIAELLSEIVAQDGHTKTLAECLRTIVVDVASRVSLSRDVET